MKTLIITLLINVLSLSVFTFSAFSQTIPIAIFAGNRYTAINVTLSKNFSDSSRFGFFHTSTSEIFYENKDDNNLMMQNLLFYEPIKSFRITGGLFYGKPGFLGTLGLQYIKKFKSFFIFFNPRLNFDTELTYDLFGAIQYTPQINSKMNFLAGFKVLQVFTSESNIKTNPELRLGFDTRSWQFGLATALNKQGQEQENVYNYGIFLVRKLL